MARILKQGGKHGASDAFGAKRVFVHGLPYDNAAAKFWTCLMDEVVEDYPEGTGVALSAPTGGLLHPDLLVPEATLARDFERLKDSDLQGTFRDVLAALEAAGPPSPVSLRLVSNRPEVKSDEIPLEFLDAEVLPFLLVWLVEWATVPDAQWNDQHVRGRFTAEDRDRGLRYKVRFDLKNQHLSEGLFVREVVLHFRREKASPDAPPQGNGPRAPQAR